MGTGRQNGTCPSSSHSRAHLRPAPALLSAVVDTQWGFRILRPLCAVVFSKLTVELGFVFISLPKTKNWFGGSFHVWHLYLSRW